VRKVVFCFAFVSVERKMLFVRPASSLSLRETYIKSCSSVKWAV